MATVPPRGTAAIASSMQIEQELDLALVARAARPGPIELDLFLADKQPGDVAGLADIDHRAGEAGGAEGEAAELQLGRCLAGRAPHQLEGKPRISWSSSSSSISRPLAMAPTGETTS